MVLVRELVYEEQLKLSANGRANKETRRINVNILIVGVAWIIPAHWNKVIVANEMMSTKLLLLFFSLFPLCFSCACPIGSSGKSRFEVICDSYDNNNEIYVVRVTAAYCKCRLPSPPNRFSCIEFMLNQTLPPGGVFQRSVFFPASNTAGSVDGAYECQDFMNSSLSSYYRNCSDVVTDAGISKLLIKPLPFLPSFHDLISFH